LMGIKQL